MINIRKLEAELWESADLLRAGSKLTSNQYCMPVLGQHAGELFALLLHQLHSVIHHFAQAVHDLAPPVGQPGGGDVLR